MLTAYSSKALSAKALAMYGKRLGENDYSEMLRRHKVSEVAEYLKNNTKYSTALRAINVNEIHRGQLENLLKREQFSYYAKLLKYEQSNNNEFYYYIIAGLEVNEILRCILLLNARSSSEFIIDLPGYLIQHARFDLLELAKTRSFDDLLQVLRGTPYHGIVEQFKPKEGERIDADACEHALFLHYYEEIFRTINKYFKGKSRESMREIFKMEIELLNLEIVYRSKVYFHKSTEEIRKFLFPYTHKINKKKWETILTAADHEELIAVFNTTVYGRHVKASPDYVIEDYTKQLTFLYSKRLLRFSEDPAIVLYAFMELSKIELRNIINIIEGIRYRVPADEIKKMLIY